MRTLLLAFVAISVTAYADPPKYTRHQIAVDVMQSSRVSPIRPISPSQPPRPSTTADAALARERAVAPIRKEQEAVLADLVRDTPDDDPQKADLMFRLAELYAMQARFWRLEAIRPLVERGP
jgi:hypothetical protein